MKQLLRTGSTPVVDRSESLSDSTMNSLWLTPISRDGAVEELADEADGVKLKLTDGVDVAKDGTVYFTDASYKYSLYQFFQDMMEGRPYGRLISYDPIFKRTDVLIADLYFPNGVAVSPLQDFVVFYETIMKDYIQGNKMVQVEKFIDNLPGLVDNIEYDGEHYWIALPMENTLFWDLALRYPMARKAVVVYRRERNGRYTLSRCWIEYSYNWNQN
ncbi:hypothetical protein V6N11_023039 [Hibiscus sabdariffa]|uniref:Strictosidine synthase conserved region domain-containing protein n=1 Tax=Hibiscus sabdariffa TaxID=183260 RepID=A0ABR2TLQ6_9ROSI